MSQLAISVEHVSKGFRVPLDRGTTLQYRFSHPVSSTRYREFLALDDIDFDVKPGEFVGITGPNGCGKSTLLKVLARIYEPDSGRVVVNGTVSPFLELGVGFKAELTARENIFLGGAVLGLTHKQLVKRTDAVLAFAELEEFADQKLKNFSSGMSVRLAFSVAMLADADVLLMDEVLAVGDARFQEKCFEVFNHYKRESRTIVLVSHDLESLSSYCDRVLLLAEGRVIGDGPPSEVVSEYRRIVGAMSEPATAVRAELDGLSPARRWGTREVEVTDVRVLGRDGEPKHTFLVGEPLTVAVDYTGNAFVDRFECGVGFRRGDGQMLATPNTKPAHYRLPAVSANDRGTITYAIPALTLLRGSYLLSAYLYDEHIQHAFDHLEDVLEFRVADERGRPGILEPGGSWEHSATAADVRVSSAAARR